MSPRIATSVNHWLIHQAARRAPADLSERLEEEWLADLTERGSAFSRFRFSLGCCWATQMIALEHQPAMAAAPAGAGGGRFTSTFADEDFQFISRRTGSFLIVVGVHAAVFAALLMTVTEFHPKKETHLTQLPPVVRKQDPVKTDGPPPDVKNPTIIVPEPFVPPVAPNPDSRVTAEPSPPDLQPLVQNNGGAAPKIVRVTGGPGVGFPNPDDYYPSFAIHQGWQGLATVQVCVDEKGRLTHAPGVVESTGHVQLDDGALRLAKAASGHYRPTTENGMPVGSCYPIRIRFHLK